MVELVWHGQRLGRLAHQTLARLDTKIQRQIPIDTVDPLVIPRVAFDVAQIQVAQPETPNCGGCL